MEKFAMFSIFTNPKFTIPKIIHFIWAGGAKLLPRDNKEIISEWAKFNESFKIYFWIDEKTTPKELAKLSGFNNLAEYYRNSFLNIEEGRFEIHDIQELKETFNGALHLYECIRYEIDKLHPNYGASSDMIRYLVLYKYGGAYFDSDVLPNDKCTLESTTIFRDYENETFYLDDNSQGTGFIGNDALICTKNHTFMFQVLNEIKESYRPINKINEELGRLIKLTYLANNEEFFTENTLYNTGPNLIHFILRKRLDTHDIKEAIGNLQNPFGYYNMLFKNLPLTSRKFGENSRNWVRLNVQPDVREIVETRIKDTIKFEAENFGIIRMEDHICDFSEAAEILPDEAEQILLKFVHEIKDKDLQILQYKSFFERVNAFYRKSALEKTYKHLREYGIPKLKGIVRDKAENGLSKCLANALLEIESSNQPKM